MSARLVFEAWQLLLPAIGFAIFFIVFALVVWRVLRMRPPAIARLEHLPLESESSSPDLHG